VGSGIFITFEGIEGCGKSTQAKRVREFLIGSGLEVVFTREPGGSCIGEKIRDILLDPENHTMIPLTELLLYEASRRQHMAEVIEPALEAGKVVICDRFYDASTAYQGYARGIDINDVERLNLIATGGKRPDLTIILDLPAGDGLKRIGRNPDRIEGEAVEFHERVRAGYLEIARREPERVKVVDGSGSIEQTFIKVRTPVENLLAERKVR
jgi:dTMP kinase